MKKIFVFDVFLKQNLDQLEQTCFLQICRNFVLKTNKLRISLSSRLMSSRKLCLFRTYHINRRIKIKDMQMRLWKYFGLTVLFCVTACPHRIAVHQIVSLFFFTGTAERPKKLWRQASDLRIQALKKSSKLLTEINIKMQQHTKILDTTHALKTRLEGLHKVQ